ncbi:MAG: molybdopterin-dependent oxidoreductase [Sporichthyaceae bacterium]
MSMLNAVRQRVSAGNEWVAAHPPPGPFRVGFWRSPIRGPWLTSVLGAVLLVGLPILFGTGLLSYLSYNPGLAGNGGREGSTLLTWVPFNWPTRPSWGYRVSQGTHVVLGAMLVPVILAKLWSVIPKLFCWPAVKTPAQALERATLLLLVGGAVFTFVTGLLNIQYWYRFPGGFYRLHFYSSWVFVGALITHVAIKFPTMRRSLRERRLRDELQVDLAHTVPEEYVPGGLVSATPAAPTISRRAALGMVAGASVGLFVVTAGQSVGGPFRRVAVLAPRGGFGQDGPNDFPVNRFAAQAGVTPATAGPTWRLQVRGAGEPIVFTRADLLAMELHSANLSIPCVEGWSTGTQRWEGVRLRDLARRAGMPDADTVLVESLEIGGAYGRGRLAGNQIRNGDSLLALRVNGVDLSLDHGFPARIVVPNNPGVRNTKWVAALTFEA